MRVADTFRVAGSFFFVKVLVQGFDEEVRQDQTFVQALNALFIYFGFQLPDPKLKGWE